MRPTVNQVKIYIGKKPADGLVAIQYGTHLCDREVYNLHAIPETVTADIQHFIGSKTPTAERPHNACFDDIAVVLTYNA